MLRDNGAFLISFIVHVVETTLLLMHMYQTPPFASKRPVPGEAKLSSYRSPFYERLGYGIFDAKPLSVEGVGKPPGKF
jgi:hypothetical protein